MQYEIRIMSTKPRELLPLAQNTGSTLTPHPSPLTPNLFMQNKPNFQNAEMNITSALTKDYENIPPTRKCENKPNSNPISIPIYAKTNPIKPKRESRLPSSVIRPPSSVFQKELAGWSSLFLPSQTPRPKSSAR